MANRLTEQDHTTRRYSLRARKPGRHGSTIATVKRTSATPVEKDQASNMEKAVRGATKNGKRRKVNSGDGDQKDMQSYNDEDTMELCGDEHNIELSNGLEQNLDTRKEKNHNPDPSALEKQKDLSPSLLTTVVRRGEESVVARDNYSNPLKRKHSSGPVDIGTLLLLKPDVKAKVKDMEDHLASKRLDIYHLCQLQLFALMSEDIPFRQLRDGLPGLSKVILDEMTKERLLSDIRDGSKELDMEYQVSDKEHRQKKDWGQWDLLCDAVVKAMKAHGKLAPELTEAEIRALSDSTLPPPVSIQAPTKIKAYLAFVAHHPKLLEMEEDWLRNTFRPINPVGDRTIKDDHPKGRQASHDDQTGQTQMDEELANLKTQVESLQKLVNEKNEQIEELKISEDERQVSLQLQSEKESADRATIERIEENLRKSTARNAILETEIISMREEKKMLDAEINSQYKEKAKLEELLTTHRSSDLKRIGELSEKDIDIEKLKRHLKQKEEDMEELKKERTSRENENKTLVAKKQAEITILTEEVGRLTKRQQEEEKRLKTGSEELQYRLTQMETEKKNLKKNLDQLSIDKERLQSEAEERTKAMSESHRHMLESQEKSKRLDVKEEAIKALEADVQEKKTANQEATERERMRAKEADDLRGEQIKLEAELRKKEGELQDVQTKFRNLQKETTDLNSKFATEKAARAEEIERLENKDKNRDKTMAQLQATKHLVEADLKDTKALLEQATGKISTLERQCDGMKELQQHLEKAQKDRQIQDEINDGLKGKLMSVLTMAKPPGDGLTGAQRPQAFPAIVDDVIRAMQDVLSREGEIEKKLTDIEAKNLALQTHEKSINGSEAVPKHQHDSLMSEYDKVLKERTALESKLRSIEKQALENKAKGDGQLTAKDATIQELKRTIESLTKSKETAEESISTIKMSSRKLEKEIEELQRKNKQAEQEKEDIKQSCHSENGSIRKRLEDAEKMLQTAQHETEEQASLREKKLQDKLTAYHAENDKLHRRIHELTEKSSLHEKDAESQNTLALKTEETLQGEVAKLRGELKKSKTLEDRLQSQIKDLEEAKKLLKDEAKRRVGLVNDNISHKANLENGVCGSITNEKRPSQTSSLNALGKSAEQKSHKSATDEASLHQQAPLLLSKCDGPVEAHAGEKQDQSSLSEDDSDTPGSPWGKIQDVRSSSLPASREDQHLSWGESDRATTNMLYSQGPRLDSQGLQENPAVQKLLSKAMARNRANGTGIPPLSENNPRSSSIGINSTSHSGQLQLISAQGDHPQVRNSYEGSNRAQVPGPVVRANTRNATSRLRTRKPTYSGGDFAPLSGSSGSRPPSSNLFPKMQIPDDMQSILDELKKSIEQVDRKVSEIEYQSSREASKRKTPESPELDAEEGQVSKRQRRRRNVRPGDTQARIDSSEKESGAKSRKSAPLRKVNVKAVNKEVIEEIPSLPKKDILILDNKDWIIDRITNHNANTTYIHLKRSLQEECKLTLLQALSLGTKHTYKKNNKQLRAIYKRNDWPMPDALAFSTVHAIKGSKFEVSFEDRDNEAKTEVSANKLLKWGYRAAHEMGDEYVKCFETNEDLERYRKNALSKLSIRKDVKS